MPKPVKKAVRKLKVPPKPMGPSDPSRAAVSLLDEHMARLQSDLKGVPQPAADFETQFKARMAELGKKGGEISGARRMENLSERHRREIATKAARARWAAKKKT
jgi:general stress protein YciG